MFHNIFSKKKLKKEKKQKIIIDNHEKNSLVASELASLGFQIEFSHLPVADYLVNDVAVERKTISDLKSSVISKRIISQLLELKQYPKNILLIEGFDESVYEGLLHENAFRGFLLSVAVDFQVPMIFTQNEKDTAKYLAVLAKKHLSKEVSFRPSKIAFSSDEQIQYILEGFPNVGPVKAKKLLKKFKSLKNIISASINDLQEILGKRALEFKSLIEYSEP